MRIPTLNTMFVRASQSLHRLQSPISSRSAAELAVRAAAA
jgi:hypothetical protein